MEENIDRIVSARMRPLVQRLETLEEKILYESLSEKDGSTAMETKGIPASNSHKKASKRLIFADIVTEKGASWMLKETGICITFSPNAVLTPIMVTSSLWRPGTILPPLEDDETLVSNIIELASDDPAVDIEFSKVTVTLSHSAADSRGYELVLKERIDSKKNNWKDLETWCPSDPLGEKSALQSELRFAQAKITSFSLYAVISRLKSYKFLVSEESPELSCTLTEYPGISLTVPTRSLPTSEDFAFTLKVQQTQNADFGESDVFVSPILHIWCPVEVKLEEPALIRIPITLEEERIDLQNLSSSQIRVFHRCTRRKSQEWAEITSKLKTPPKLENGVVSFQVKRFSKFVVVFGSMLRQIHDFMKRIVSFGQQAVRFLAFLSDSGYTEQYLLILCCLPCHINHGVWKEMCSKYSIISYGECASDRPLKRGDHVFFRLPDAYTLLKEENAYLTFLGQEQYEKSFPIRVGSTEAIPSIKFFTLKNGHREEQTLCCVPLSKELSPQDFPRPLASRRINLGNHPELWKRGVTLKQLLPLMDEFGDCWRPIGLALDFSQAELNNIDRDHSCSKGKATAMLGNWIEKEASDATMGRLALVLSKNEKNNIVEKMIELLHEMEKEENEALSPQWKKKKDQPRGESSPGAHDSEEKDDLKILEVECLQAKVMQQEKAFTELISKLEDAKQQEEAAVARLSELNNALKIERELTQELKQRLEESQILDEEHKHLQDQIKEKEEAVIKLTSELKIKEKRAQEQEQRVAELELTDAEFKRLQDEGKKKDEEIKQLQFKLEKEQNQNKKQVEESIMLVDDYNKLQYELHEKEDRINQLTSALENEKTRVQNLEQQAEESGMVEEENKRSKDGEIEALKSDLENARQEEQRRGEETGILVGECYKLNDEVKEKEERIKKLTSELEGERKRIQELEQQIHESKIVEEELKRLAPA